MKKALVVGINNYPQSPLSGCVNDSSAVAQLIRKNGDGSPNFDVLEINDIQKKGELKTLVKELFSGENEIALFYFSGHGCKTNSDGFIVTPDYGVGDEGISMTEILTIVNGSKAINKIVVLDCCYSGTFGNSPLSDNITQISEGVTILTASLDSQSAQETGGHGIFSNLFLEALNGGAANINGLITPGSVYAYIDQALGAWDQRPMFKTNTKGFVCLRSVNPSIELSVLRNIIKYFPSPSAEYKLDPSYEFTNSESYNVLKMEPYATESNIFVFKELQKMSNIGLIKPIGEDHMYFAAMNSKSCKLTALGYHYWQLVKKDRI